jgi:hypothetical protein
MVRLRPIPRHSLSLRQCRPMAPSPLLFSQVHAVRIPRSLLFLPFICLSRFFILFKYEGGIWSYRSAKRSLRLRTFKVKCCIGCLMCAFLPAHVPESIRNSLFQKSLFLLFAKQVDWMREKINILKLRKLLKLNIHESFQIIKVCHEHCHEHCHEPLIALAKNVSCLKKIRMS